MEERPSILIIYTGGTIGMIMDDDGVLVPFDFEGVYEQIPILKKYHYDLEFYCFDPLLDSSNMNPEV